VRARPETTLVQVTAAVQRRENVRVRSEKIERGCAGEKKIEREDVLVKRKERIQMESGGKTWKRMGHVGVKTKGARVRTPEPKH
jgi:hypothetical protein